MIAPDRTRAEFLAEIDAPDQGTNPLTDLTDPRIATDGVHVRVGGHAKEDLFPLLDLALSERFAAVSRIRLLRDLLIPVRKALGNAHKHGNGGDPAKQVIVELVLAPGGALVSITDEGAGFDVRRTFQGFEERRAYFVNQGSGFRNLHRAHSTVSYENGGRTLLLCYRPSAVSDASDGAAPDPAPVVMSECLRDQQWIQRQLSRLPEFRDGGSFLTSCRVYGSRISDAIGPRYVLRVEHAGGEAETRILTGRVHQSEAAARADFEAASRLCRSLTTRLRIPRPVTILEDARVVLYEFDPSMNLAEYLAYRGGLSSVRHSAERVGQTLAALHSSSDSPTGAGSAAVRESLEPRIAAAENTLRTLASGSDFVNRFRAIAAPMTAPERQPRPAPIHGALTWGCIYYGVDARFYLYQFEKCRWSDPRLDLGGFAADMLRFALDHHDGAAYRSCTDELLKHYNANVSDHISAHDLRACTALALCERLQLALPGAATAQWIAALETLIRDRADTAAANS